MFLGENVCVLVRERKKVEREGEMVRYEELDDGHFKVQTISVFHETFS